MTARTNVSVALFVLWLQPNTSSLLSICLCPATFSHLSDSSRPLTSRREAYKLWNHDNCLPWWHPEVSFFPLCHSSLGSVTHQHPSVCDKTSCKLKTTKKGHEIKHVLLLPVVRLVWMLQLLPWWVLVFLKSKRKCWRLPSKSRGDGLTSLGTISARACDGWWAWTSPVRLIKKPYTWQQTQVEIWLACSVHDWKSPSNHRSCHYYFPYLPYPYEIRVR